MPRIDDMLDWLNGAKYFSWIDSKLKYFQIHITDEDVKKLAMKIRYNSYVFLVMPFGLCNVLLMFTTLMNSILHKKFDEFVIIYIDDNLVYSKTIEEHMEHLEYVLNKFHDNKH